MKKLTTSLAMGCSALLFSIQAFAVTFDSIYIFGDSLSDSGAYVGNLDAGGGGRFTTNPGPVWSEIVGTYYGLDVVSNNPNNLNTSPLGNNYAQGGAQVSNPIGIGQTPSPQSALSVSAQINNYLSSSPDVNSSGLYTLWAGANDIFYNAALVGGGLDIPSAINNMYVSATELVSQADLLNQAGAGTILIPNLPNIVSAPATILSAIATVGAANPNVDLALRDATFVLRTPANSPTDQLVVQQAAIDAAVSQLGSPAGILSTVVAETGQLFSVLGDSYNGFLDQLLIGAPENILLLDIETLFFEALANPAIFGISNVTGTACNSLTSLSCTAAYFASVDADQSFLFADGVHPTSLGHDLIAEFAIGALEGSSISVPEPSVILLLGPVFGLLAFRRKRAV